ncbi:MAG: two-component system sensor histidine kinase NtrB [Terriglobales bacterium]
MFLAWLFQPAHLEVWFALAAAVLLVLAAIAVRQAAATRRELARRIAAERDTASAEFQARLLLDCSEDGIYALDPKGHCLWSNRAAARLFGFAAAEPMLGQQMHHLIHHTRPDGSPYPLAECTGLEQLLAGQKISQGEELLWRADGSSFFADVRVSPMIRDGQVLGAVVVFRDLTERRKLEAQVREAHKLEAVGRLAAGIAHEFNNLLSVVTGHADLLRQRHGLDATSQRQLAQIEHAGTRAAELTRRLLAFSRRQVLQPVVLQLNDVVEATARTLRQLLRAEIVLDAHCAPDLALVRADPVQIEQALLHLVLNAAEAIRAGGHIEIRTGNVTLNALAAADLALGAGAYASLTVSDTGAGMDAETQEHIFEPFFTTKPTGQATGLSLATVFGFVRQSGGGIAVQSTPGQGTSVRLYLPAAATPVTSPASSAIPSSTQARL